MEQKTIFKENFPKKVRVSHRNIRYKVQKNNDNTDSEGRMDDPKLYTKPIWYLSIQAIEEI